MSLAGFCRRVVLLSGSFFICSLDSFSLFVVVVIYQSLVFFFFILPALTYFLFILMFSVLHVQHKG